MKARSGQVPPRVGRSFLVRADRRAEAGLHGVAPQSRAGGPLHAVAAPKAALPAAGSKGLIRLPLESGLQISELDGTETAVFARHDAVEIFHGRKTVLAMSISTNVAFKLGVFLVRWWIWNCWFGLREKGWRWLNARR